MERGWTYAFLRAFTTIVTRDVLVDAIIGDMAEGRSVVHASFVGDDEVAHHSGPERADAIAVVRDLDRRTSPGPTDEDHPDAGVADERRHQTGWRSSISSSVRRLGKGWLADLGHPVRDPAADPAGGPLPSGLMAPRRRQHGPVVSGGQSVRTMSSGFQVWSKYDSSGP